MGCSCLKNNKLKEKENEFLITEDNNNSNNSQNIEKEENIILKNEQLLNKQNTQNTSSNKEVPLKSNQSINNSLNNINNNDEKNNKEENNITKSDINININKEINNNKINKDNPIVKKESFYITNNLYNKKILEIINKIREKPSDYSKFVLDNISNIKSENREVLDQNTGMKEYKQIIVFKKKVKIQLYKGENSFLDAAKVLKKTPPMHPLEFKEDIIIPIPETKEQLNSDIIKTKALNSNIMTFFKGNIKNPEIAVLMMIVDDSKSSEKKKRNSILNKDFKFIGIDSKFIGKNFFAHFSFSE